MPDPADRERALARMIDALTSGQADVFADALAGALRAGASRGEIDACMATAAGARRPSGRGPFDPFELSEVFSTLPLDP